MDLKTATLIEEIQLNALLPDGMFTNADIISFLNDAYYGDVLPFIMRHREDFYVTYTDFSPAASITIPSDAIAQKIKDIQVKKGDYDFYNLPRLSQNELNGNNRIRNEGFYIQDNSVIFFPRAQTNTIRLTYFARPIPMYDSTDYYIVDSVVLTDLNPYVKLTAVMAATVQAGTVFTLSKGYQPFGTDTVTTNINSDANVFYMSEEDCLKCTAGDVIGLYGYRMFPKIPEEAKDCLVNGAIVKAMVAMKDKDGYKIAKDELNSSKAMLSGLISPRVDNEVKKIVNTSPIWGSKNRWGR